MSKIYKHIFFDLDHTLWDFDTNSKHTLWELFLKYKFPDKLKNNFEAFYKKFLEVNFIYWEKYRTGQISKDQLRTERFPLIFNSFDFFDETIIQQVAADYVIYGPQKSGLIDFARELLDYLNRKYSLHIITNGFTEVQYIKMQSSGIFSSFNQIITSENAGFKKPDTGIFNYALNSISANANQCLMIGDELHIDILGAKNAGIDQVYFNPKGLIHNQVVSYEVRSLKEIFSII